MSRLFNGTSDEVVWSIGGASLTGAWTFAVLVKFDAGVTWQSLLMMDVSGAALLGMERHGTGGDLATVSGSGSNTQQSGISISSSDGWVLLAASRPSGTNQVVRYTKYPIGGSPTHANSSATGHDNSVAQNGIVFSNFDGADWFKGRLAVAALWNTNLNDAQMESLAEDLTRTDWLALSPVFLVDELDVFQTDYAGTSTRTSISGTTDDADDPTGWENWAGVVNPGPRRMAGPTTLGTSAATMFTVPSGRRFRIDTISVSNPTGSAADFTLSLGTDSAGTRMFDGLSIPADSERTFMLYQIVNEGEVVQAFAGTASALVLIIDGTVF